MKFGVLAPSLRDVDLIVRAEELGYDFCWAPDSQMIYPNPFVAVSYTHLTLPTIYSV